MPESWASKSAGILRQRAADSERRELDRQETRRLLNEQGPGLWRTICTRAQELCTQLNQELGQEVATVVVSSSNQLGVRLTSNGGVNELTATFETTTSNEALRWSYSGEAARSSHGGQYQIFTQGSVAYLGHHSNPRTPEGIAEEMMSGLIGPAPPKF
jgi:hypothetical protein